MITKRKPKSKLQKKRDNPRSKLWKTKCDRLWGQLIHSAGHCAICDSTANLEAHHLISRANISTRWEVWNGILLCSLHHKWSPRLSAHGAPLAFAHWLQEARPETWSTVCRHKEDIGKVDFREKHEYLAGVLKLQGGEASQ